MSAKSADLKKEVTSVTPAIPENGVNKAGVTIAIKIDGGAPHFERTGAMSARGIPTGAMTATSHPTDATTDHRTSVETTNNHNNATNTNTNAATTTNVTASPLESGIQTDMIETASETVLAELRPHQE